MSEISQIDKSGISGLRSAELPNECSTISVTQKIPKNIEILPHKEFCVSSRPMGEFLCDKNASERVEDEVFSRSLIDAMMIRQDSITVR